MKTFFAQCKAVWGLAPTENSIWIVYFEQEGELFLHVGAEIAEDCDLSGMESALRNKNEPDSCFRGLDTIAALLDALQQDSNVSPALIGGVVVMALLLDTGTVVVVWRKKGSR